MLCSVSQTVADTLGDVCFLHWTTSELFCAVRVASIVVFREVAFHLSGEIVMFYHVLRITNLEITWVHDLSEVSRIYPRLFQSVGPSKDWSRGKLPLSLSPCQSSHR